MDKKSFIACIGWAALVVFARPASAEPPVVSSCAAAQQTAAKLLSTGMFAEAADAYDSYSHACSKAADAPPSLARALELYYALDEPKAAKSAVRFFVRSFAQDPSIDLDRVIFARANYDFEAGNFRAVVSSVQNHRFLPERAFEAKILTLEAQTGLTGVAGTEKAVRRLLDEWNQAHSETKGDVERPNPPLSDFERRMTGRLGRLAVNALCRDKDRDLDLTHPKPGKMSLQQYSPVVIDWIRRRQAAIGRRRSCYEAAVWSIKPAPPVREVDIADLTLAKLMRQFRGEIHRIAGYDLVRNFPRNWMSDSPTVLEAHQDDLRIRAQGDLEWCVRVSVEQRYMGEAFIDCERELHDVLHGVEHFDWIEMIPALRMPASAVMRPEPVASAPEMSR
jgi:hypothetical protein